MKGFAHDAKHTSLSVKHGGGNAMAWVCITASETDSLIFFDDIIHDDNRRKNYEVHKMQLK